ncbi:sugar-binding transcriptional regulator [Bacillaceae bacterium SIJ1]|uniref:sugar-binding transcriptional regulator n=1 Tax=Litoribacterium kuwaitense TaxID=1398745 RepID=UPI0013EB16CC|nr:sugar-binding transcriptional regulator [Litoribacterium kuwaitense]NGP46695.1 sugar-binding transcriptional regulator [Litoribacterium kuwaitense]
MYSQEEMIRVAKLYYEMNLTQKEIAERLPYSRATISRMLDTAYKQGIIQVKINYPLNSVQQLEEKISTTYSIKKVFVSPVYVEDPTLILKDVGRAAAQYLYEICNDDCILGVSWGKTLASIYPHLNPKNVKNMKVVQLNGGIAKNSFSTGAAQLLEKFSEAFSTGYHLLSVPTIVDSEMIARVMTSDSSINETLELVRESNIAIFGIGNVSYDNVLYKGGFFKENSYEELISKKAVGDICSRYFRIDGKLADEELNKRTIGLRLEDLRKKEHSIAVASGKSKAKSVIGALNGGYVNALFIDEVLATEMIKLTCGENEREGSKII